MNMDLAQSFRKECIQIGSAAQDKAGLLREIAALAVRSPVLAGYPPERIFAALQEREKIGSTGFGNGIAIPHCNLKDVEDFVVGVLILPRGIDFDALDKKQTRILFFIIGPEDRRNQHIQILSSISKLLKTPQTIEDLLGAQTPEKVFETVLARLGPVEEPEERKGRSLFHVFVQKEELFDEILQILSAAVEGSIAVLEASNAGYYLHELPLFSAFWSDRSRGFLRVVLAVVRRELSNDVIRRIHMAVENMDREPGVLITVQDLFYSSGSIEF
jgi:mannitol/fructose-specific phosphotransferase system IIA component (Ntr-type)